MLVLEANWSKSRYAIMGSFKDTLLYTEPTFGLKINNERKLSLGSNGQDLVQSELNLCSRNHMSRVVRKPVFCVCESKDADQLRGNREADQRLCFRYTDSAIPRLPKSEISGL